MNYIKKIRTKLGNDLFIHPAARIIIENEEQEIVIVERVDTGKIGLPAGGLEEGETIEQGIKREVKEETGLELLQVEVIGISSHPTRETVIYPNGDRIQYFTIEFYSNQYEGQLKTNDTAEIKRVYFKHQHTLQDLPENERSALESLAFYKKTGKLMLK